MWGERMTDNQVIEVLKSLKDDYVIPKDGVREAVDKAITSILSQQRIMKELDKGIEAEMVLLDEATKYDQFSDTFNHHLWIMRGLKIARAIIEGKKYEDFTPENVK